MRLVRRRYLVAPILALALAAPGGVASAVSGERHPRDPRKAVRPADQARARQIGLKLADLPPGWRAERSDPDDTVRCPPYYNPDLSDLTLTAEVDSPDFSRGETDFASSSVSIYLQPRQAQRAFLTGLQPGVRRCLEEMLEMDATAENPFEVLSITRAPSPRAGGARSAAFRIVAEVGTGGETSRLYFTVIGIQRDRVVASLALGRLGKPVSAALERVLATKLAGRINR